MIDVHALIASCPPGPSFPWATCRTCRAPLRSDGAACTGPGRHAHAPRSLQMYATWTGTRENLAAMHAEGFRLIVGPDQLDRLTNPPLAWAIDNGAWGAFRAGTAFDATAFREVLRRWGSGADWIALPDIVAGGRESLALSMSWLDEVRAQERPALLPVQDGMLVEEIAPLVGPGLGLFLGGSTAWKWRSLAAWGEVAQRTGAYLHVARVNSQDAIRACIAAGAHSGDGTSASKWSVNTPGLGAATQAPVAQPTLPGLFPEARLG